MKKLLTITAAGLFMFAGAASAGEGLKASVGGGCGYGHAVQSVSTVPTVPTVTPVPTKTASQIKSTSTTGG